MLDQLLNDFGYLALFIGTFLEGETILVLAGVAADTVSVFYKKGLNGKNQLTKHYFT